MSRPPTSSNQPLPAKELGTFRRIVKCYENKQFKIGLKLCKQVLDRKEFAEHGETLAMKGLILNCLGKEAEALETVKLGLKRDVGSYVCWHVYGLVLRQGKQYDEALKAYKMALARDKENQQILRDLCLLQIQVRDYEGYKDSRYRLLKLRPQIASWYGYATAFHLLKDYPMALSIIDEYMRCYPGFAKAESKQGKSDAFARSELILYQNMIMREAGQYSKALELLEENAALVIDRRVYHETRGSLLLSLGQNEAAANVYQMLLKRNPENLDYYKQLEVCMGLTDDDIDAKLKFYDDLAIKFPRSSIPRREPLYFADAKELRFRLLVWIVNMLRKGVPSLFKSLIPLYKDHAKVQVLESVLKEFIGEIDKRGYKRACFTRCKGKHESPSTALWLYYLLAQHYDRVGNQTLAMEYINRTLDHTPTLNDMYMVKAKIEKHRGNLLEAARLMEEAQLLDTADRYVNSKCAKYLLRAGLIKEAEMMCGKFTRDGTNASINLNEMQCMWYALEVARAERSVSHYGDALKSCHQIEQHFVNITDDQFDFHTYCLRKSTLCSYINLLRLEDRLRNNEWYYQAAKCAAKIYLRMLDRPGDIFDISECGEEMSAEEIKKMKRKQAKVKARAAEKEQQKTKGVAGQVEKQTKKEEGIEPVGINIDPEELLKTKTPLDEALKFIAPVIDLGCTHVTGYLLGFEIYYRKEKPLRMLQCLKAAQKIDQAHPLLHIANVKFLLYLRNFNRDGVVGELVKELTEELFGDERNPVDFNKRYQHEIAKDFGSKMAVLECNILLEPGSVPAAKKTILECIKDATTPGRSLKILIKMRDAIRYGRFGEWSRDEVAEFMRVCHLAYPYANAFGGGAKEKENIEASKGQSTENGDADH
ncbi:unnamed protein product, partial [Mesorhabditis belari]|uniref:Uncharacterized protein n=1 Tax=Mesorhabditis belari TaxID=2138241 RepID=A0AAF3J1B1_9BILA